MIMPQVVPAGIVEGIDLPGKRDPEIKHKGTL